MVYFFLCITMIALTVGLVSPILFRRMFRRVITRKQIAGYFAAALIVLVTNTILTGGKIETSSHAITAENQAQQTEQFQATELALNTDPPNSEIRAIEKLPSETLPFKKIAAAAASQAVDTTTTQKFEAKSRSAVPITEPVVESKQKLYKVVRVADGDTITVAMESGDVTLRLIGVDTPETVHPSKLAECFGKEASSFTKSTLYGKEVALEADSSQGEQDKYGRLLRYVFLSDGTNFNEKLIRDGYAYEYTYRSAYKYQYAFKTAQKEAQSVRAGLWGDICSGEKTTASTESKAPIVKQGTGAPSATTKVENSSKKSSSNSATGYYTSSHHTATRYYPASCSAWESLSKTNLKYFETLTELQAKYNRTLSPQCK